MTHSIFSAALTGVSASLVEVEARVGSGQPKFSIIGLADSAVKESRERVTAALRASGFSVPSRVLINLAPAERKKEGTALDLPIALSILAASGAISANRLKDHCFVGELALDGRVKPVRGAIALATAAARSALPHVVTPAQNFSEVSLVKSIKAVPAATIADVIQFVTTGELALDGVGEESEERSVPNNLLEDVVGQRLAKRALMLAACGGHHLLMVGPPGCGKSMLARRLCSILPTLSDSERLEAAAMASISGAVPKEILSGARPFRAPHHVITDVGLVGGGTRPRPGEISLAHHGVLFLDEFPEFRRQALEALRAPLETGEVQITRSQGTEIFPADFQLVVAMNPCPCGRLGSGGACDCDRESIRKYLAKLSGPILDRIDMQIELDPVPLEELSQKSLPRSSDSSELTTANALESVERVRLIQRDRQGGLNRSLSLAQLVEAKGIETQALRMLEECGEKLDLSARGFTRVLRLARTIADVVGRAQIVRADIEEALSYRSLERIRRYAGG